jgi:hypothetical protein
MRAEILDYINTLSLGGFLLSQEYPWIDSGTTTLYIKNPKKIYVDAIEYSNEPFIQTLNSVNINNETSTVRIYFACDAKQIPSNYDTLVSDIKAAKDITTIDGIQRRQVDVTTAMESDLLVTTVELRFTKLST